ncbi:hypothetical protein FRC06_004763 [Ceratobasidium sp. 370]|nr:hypothetical protein FRC06_004763 [Ceratobasidium sp. 370]
MFTSHRAQRRELPVLHHHLKPTRPQVPAVNVAGLVHAPVRTPVPARARLVPTGLVPPLTPTAVAAAVLARPVVARLDDADVGGAGQEGSIEHGNGWGKRSEGGRARLSVSSERQEPVASGSWSLGKGKGKVNIYADELDQLREEVETGWAKIQHLEEDVASLRALRGEISVLREQVGRLEQAECNVKEMHTSVGTLARLLQSGTNNAEDQSVAEHLALEGALKAVAASVATPDLVPGPSRTKRLHKKKEEEEMYQPYEERFIVDHVRVTLYRLMGIKVSREILRPVKNTDGTWKFWVEDNNGVKVLRPVWTSDLGDNRHPKWGWVQCFVAECQDVEHMKKHWDFLVKVSPSKFKKDSCNAVCKGTVLEGPEFDFIGSREFQSPEASDAENDNCKIIDQPLYHSDQLIRILDALALKHKVSKTKASPATKAIIVYYKTNSPIPVLLGGLCIGRWCVDDDWARKNPEAFEEGRCYIDVEAKNPPDVTELLSKFPPRPRTYVPRRPPRVKGTIQPLSPPHTEPQVGGELFEGPVEEQLEVQPDAIEDRAEERAKAVEERVEEVRRVKERVQAHIQEHIQERVEEHVQEQCPTINVASE